MLSLNSLELIHDIDDEPRIQDIDLAERLDMARVTNIRNVIAANRDELEAFGGLHLASANPGKLGGRPGKAYYLNEGQALVLCALSRTPKAAEVRKMLIELFMAYRQGKVVHVNEHKRRAPMRERGDTKRARYDFHINSMLAFTGQVDDVYLHHIAVTNMRMEALQDELQTMRSEMKTLKRMACR